jgi:hypothetical protein
VGLPAAILLCTGCTYLQNRGNDGAQVFDVGITVSGEPGFSLYAGLLNLLTLGYSHVDGYIIGVGSGHGGVVPMRDRAYGLLLYGEEEFGYDEDLNPSPWNVGIIGLIAGEPPCDGAIVNCPKLLHLGFIGLTLNCKFGELADFLLGWFGPDTMSDDVAARVPKPSGDKALVMAPRGGV